MIFKLNKSDIEYIKEYADNAFLLMKDISEKEGLSTFFVDDYTDFIVELNYAVVGIGMDDEDTINKIGERLYSIIDNIVNQKHSA